MDFKVGMEVEAVDEVGYWAKKKNNSWSGSEDGPRSGTGLCL